MKILQNLPYIIIIIVVTSVSPCLHRFAYLHTENLSFPNRRLQRFWHEWLQRFQQLHFPLKIAHAKIARDLCDLRFFGDDYSRVTWNSGSRTLFSWIRHRLLINFSSQKSRYFVLNLPILVVGLSLLYKMLQFMRTADTRDTRGNRKLK